VSSYGGRGGGEEGGYRGGFRKALPVEKCAYVHTPVLLRRGEGMVKLASFNVAKIAKSVSFLKLP